MKGNYLLLIELLQDVIITVGSLKDVHFPLGYYAYVGSAMGGLSARVQRHLRREKKRHWHIDYLLEQAPASGALIVETQDKMECTIAQALSRRFREVSRFGSSDCTCMSHLFWSAHEMLPALRALLNTLNIKQELIQEVIR